MRLLRYLAHRGPEGLWADLVFVFGGVGLLVWLLERALLGAA